MAKKMTFGQYWPGESVVHRLDPRTKLVALVVAIVAIFMAESYPAQGVAALFVLAFLALSRVPVKTALRSILPLLFFVVFMALFSLLFVPSGEIYAQWGPVVVSSGGVYTGVFTAIRLFLLLLSAAILTLTTTTIDITDALERFLSPFSRIGLPAHEFSMVMGIALRFLPQFSEELRIIRAAQLARGAKITSNPLTGGLSGLASIMVPLFTSAFRHAETLSNGMDARCYHGGNGRTRLNPLRFEMRDGLALLALAIMLACVIAGNNLL